MPLKMMKQMKEVLAAPATMMVTTPCNLSGDEKE
jgi:hypothetical protein